MGHASAARRAERGSIIGVVVQQDAFGRVFETARALGEETRFRIYRQLCLSSEPSSVSELAGDFSLHPNAVRQHLARLEHAGLVVSRSHREGGAGRPRRLYNASPEPVGLAAPRSPEAMISVLRDAIETLEGGRDELVRFGRAWGRAWAARRRGENGMPRARRARAEVLSAELAAWGWSPRTRQEGDRLRLETGRCIFRAASPGPNGRCCAVEEGLLGALSEGILNGTGQVSIEGCRLSLTV